MLVNTPLKEILFSVVRISTIKTDGAQSVGTGFIFNVSRDPRKAAPVLITNKHVVAGAVKASMNFIGADGDKPRFGANITANYDKFESLFVGHPNENVDIACMGFGSTIAELTENRLTPFWKAANPSIFPNDGILDDFDAIEEVFFVGYPNALYDTSNLTPIMRRGSTATPIHLNWCGLPSFLIDAAVFQGSSGSPVFLIQQHGWRSGTTYQIGNTRIFLVGILAAVHLQPTRGRISVSVAEPYVEFDQFMDLGVVFNWKAIEEAVNELFDVNGWEIP